MEPPMMPLVVSRDCAAGNVLLVLVTCTERDESKCPHHLSDNFGRDYSRKEATDADVIKMAHAMGWDPPPESRGQVFVLMDVEAAGMRNVTLTHGDASFHGLYLIEVNTDD